MVGEGIVPITDLMDIFSGRQGSASGHADRAGCIGFCEERASSSQGIQGWRDVGWIAVAASDMLLVLVGENEKEVRLFPHSVYRSIQPGWKLFLER